MTTSNLLACDNSGVKLLSIMYAECDKLNETADPLILDEFNALTSRGLETKTTAGFSEHRTQLTKLNNSMTASMCATMTTSLWRTTSPPCRALASRRRSGKS